ncbi:MAG TPA: hypothetical protein VF043_11010 [Ktedonobacteraceae bacterium]
MLDDMFSLIDPIVELSEDNTRFVIQVETFFEFLEQIGLDRAANSPEGTKIEVPLDIVMSLLRPDELEKLKNYITSYLKKRDGSEVASPALPE